MNDFISQYKTNISPLQTSLIALLFNSGNMELVYEDFSVAAKYGLVYDMIFDARCNAVFVIEIV